MTDFINGLFNYIPEKYRGWVAAILILYAGILKIRSMAKSETIADLETKLGIKGIIKKPFIAKWLDRIV